MASNTTTSLHQKIKQDEGKTVKREYPKNLKLNRIRFLRSFEDLAKTRNIDLSCITNLQMCDSDFSNEFPTYICIKDISRLENLQKVDLSRNKITELPG